jgi:hypothetical protein
MRLFSRSKPSAPLARVSIQFPNDFETNSSVSVIIEGVIPPQMEAWVWDLFYAKTLYTLGRCGVADGMKGSLESWATRAFLLTAAPLQDERIMFDPEMILSRTPLPSKEVYQIDVLPGKRGWPTILTHLPGGGFQNRHAYSVLALGQYLVDALGHNFTCELAANILEMQKYYADVAPYSKLSSLMGAPTHAISAALELISSTSAAINTVSRPEA